MTQLRFILFIAIFRTSITKTGKRKPPTVLEDLPDLHSTSYTTSTSNNKSISIVTAALEGPMGLPRVLDGAGPPGKAVGRLQLLNILLLLMLLLCVHRAAKPIGGGGRVVATVGTSDGSLQRSRTAVHLAGRRGRVRGRRRAQGWWYSEGDDEDATPRELRTSTIIQGSGDV